MKGHQLAGEIPVDRDEQWRETQSAPGSVLERHVTFTVSAGRWIAVAAALLAGTLLRLPGLDRWALSPVEAETALAARDLLLGNDIPSDLIGRPFVIEWTLLFMFIGDSVDSVARMSAAVAGIGVIALVLLLGRWIGPIPSIAAAVLIAFSPTMIANSRRVDGGTLLVFLTLAVLVSAIYAHRRPSVLSFAALGVSAAALMLSGPLGVLALLLTALALYLSTRHTSVSISNFVPVTPISFAVSYVLISTAFFTRPAGVVNATVESFRLLFSEHIANIGGRFHVPLFNLLINEPLLIVLAIVGLVASRRQGLARGAGIWTLAALVLVSLAGDTGIAGHALVVLPLALLAGLGAAHMVERLPWPLIFKGPAAVYGGLVILLFLAFVSIVGLLAPDGGLSGWDWIVRLLLVVVVIVLPLSVGLSMLARRVAGHQLVLLVGAALLLFSALTVRSGVLAASERPGEPMDPLADDGIAASMPAVIERVQRISTDLTRTDRSAQDPTGGHGLRIVVDERLEQPLSWYFRDYTNLTIVDPATDTVGDDVQVVFLAGDRNGDDVAPGLVGETYLFAHDAPDLYSDPDWSHLLGGIFSVGEWRNFWGFLIERSDPPQESRTEFQLLVTPAIGDRLFGPSGPFSLDDMAGAGIEGGQFNAPRGIALAQDGSTYVVDAGNQRVQIFDASGDFVSSFGENGSGPGQFASFGSGQGGPGGIAIDDERVYVADTWNHRIQVFDLDGTFITSWGSFFDTQDDPEQSESSPGQFYGPRGIAVHNDLVYVTDTGNERLQIFDTDGQFVAIAGGIGSEEGQLSEPVGIAISDETVYVADSHNSRIALFSLDGEPLESWEITEWNGLRFFEPYLATADDGRLFATSSLENEILVIGENGQNINAIGGADTLQPYGIVIRPDGSEALVTDGIRNAVVEVNIAPR